MKKEIITIIALGSSVLLLSSCESPEEKAKRLACEELMSLNITAPQYDAQLVAEAAKGSVKRMQLLLLAGADVNAVDDEGSSPLRAAIMSQNTNAVKFLIENGADVSHPGKQGETPIFTAVRNRNNDVRDLLIAAGARMDSVDKDGNTLLMVAAEAGNKAFVQKLLEHGIEVNESNAEGNTAIHLSVSDVELLKLLLNAGAEVNVCNSNGETALHDAVSNPESLKLLLASGADINVLDKQGYTPLMKAVKQQNVEAVQVLLNAKADASIVCPGNLPLIALAAESGQVKIVQDLIDYGINAESNFTINGKITNALSYAKSKEVRELFKKMGCYEIISTDEAIRLLEKYEIINFNPYSDVSSNPFSGTSAIKKGNEVVKLSKQIMYEYQLVKEGTKKVSDYSYINTIYDLRNALPTKHFPTESVVAFAIAGSGLDKTHKKTNSFDELVHACRWGDATVVKILLDYPGFIDDLNKANLFSNPLDYAAEGGHADVVKVLLSASSLDIKKLGEIPVYRAVEKGHVDTVKALLADSRIDVNGAYMGKGGPTPLEIAIVNENTEMVKILLSAPGVDVNHKGGEPLYLAAKNRNMEIVKLLLAAPGIDVDAAISKAEEYKILDNGRSLEFLKKAVAK